MLEIGWRSSGRADDTVLLTYTNEGIMVDDIVRSAYLTAILGLVFSSVSGAARDIPAHPVVPSAQQLAYQQMEIIGFICYTVNAFTDQEWGDGSEKPAIFNPTALDVEQWVTVAQAGGLKQLILTAKHHDGFCLWPSQYTDHTIKQSPYKNGRGDIVGELAQACRRVGLKFGLYLSPWDRNHAEYGRAAYLTYFRNQLRELLTQYGPISEMWFDGANGGDGWYGGANETRRIDGRTYYDWPTTWALVRDLQPQNVIFCVIGPDIRWIGNEKGIAGETCWSMFNRVEFGDSADFQAYQPYLNTGDPNGTHWVVGECDVSIRPGWFYHKHQDDKVKTPQQLVDLYYKSVGRNSTLLLNLPPDRRGLIHENDIAALQGFKAILDETFRTNLALGARVKATSQWDTDPCFAPRNVTDADPNSYWAARAGDTTGVVTITLPATRTFDRILLQEPIRLGQRIARFTVEARLGRKWEPLATATTIGYKRLLRIEPVTTQTIRIKIEAANSTPALSHIGLYRASAREAKP
jgi:alpha-L-fucosidase